MESVMKKLMGMLLVGTALVWGGCSASAQDYVGVAAVLVHPQGDLKCDSESIVSQIKSMNFGTPVTGDITVLEVSHIKNVREEFHMPDPGDGSLSCMGGILTNRGPHQILWMVKPMESDKSKFYIDVRING
jgi:hypothetical protein